jgi:hypothetical protein
MNQTIDEKGIAAHFINYTCITNQMYKREDYAFLTSKILQFYKTGLRGTLEYNHTMRDLKLSQS